MIRATWSRPHVEALPPQLAPELVGPIHGEVLVEHPADLWRQLGVFEAPGRGRTSLRRVVALGGDLQDPADRLDPPRHAPIPALLVEWI